MQHQIFILQPRPRPLCGVTDHSLRLLEELGRLRVQGQVITLNELSALPKSTLADAGVLIQASIYGFNAKGVPMRLLLELHRARKAGARLSTFFHELWVPNASIGSSAFWLNPAQRAICSALASLSYSAHFNTGWALGWGKAQLGHLARYSPSYSNVGEPASLMPWGNRPPVLACFGAPKNRAAAYQALLPHLASLAAGSHVRAIVDIGDDPSIAPVSALEATGVAVSVLGPLPPTGVSEQLSRARFGMHFTPWSLATKSGIYGALLAHGTVPVSIHEHDTLPLACPARERQTVSLLLGVGGLTASLRTTTGLDSIQSALQSASSTYKSASRVANEVAMDLNIPVRTSAPYVSSTT